MRPASALLLFAVTCGPAALTGCHPKPKDDGSKAAALRAQARRNQTACASQVAYDQLKSQVFDQAIEEHGGDRSGLDTLADYSLARMEQPVVQGHDASLDLTRCEGHLVLDLPPGAEKGFGGDRQLAANVAYSAQASADGKGYVYRLSGAEPIVARLKDFALPGADYRVPAGVEQQGEEVAVAAPPQPAAPEPEVMAGGQRRDYRSVAPPRPAPRPPRDFAEAGPRRTAPVEGPPDDDRDVAPPRSPGADPDVVRGFYAALGAGRGSAASRLVVPEKRSTRTYSPEAISRFYGNLREPLRLTDMRQISRFAFRVRYHYSPGRTRCNGEAIVETTERDGQTYIRSIRSLSGC